MKVLVPMDFSLPANDALETCMQMSNYIPIELTLFHCIESEWQQSEDSYLSAFDNEKLYIQKAIDRKINSKGLNNVCVEIRHGKFLKQLKDLDNNENYDLILMGSHGQSGKQEWFIGSNAQKVVRSIECKVMVVKEKSPNFDLKEVVFVTNLETKDKKPFVKFLEFIKQFDCKKVHILSVDTLGYFHQPTVVMKKAADDFKRLAYSFNKETHFVKNISVDTGVRRFVSSNNIQLVGIANHGKSYIRRMLQGSNVEMLVNHLDIPIISMNY